MIRSALCTGLLFFVSLVSLSFGCGGGQTGPTALKWKYDEVHIAQLSMDAKSAMLQAQDAYQRARAEHMKAEADYRESKTKLQVAKNERSQALLAEKSAKEEKRAADASSDMNRINRAMKDMRAAELARKAADAKVTLVKVERKFLKAWVRYTLEEAYHKEARYEYAKAQLGQQNNIAPKGVKYERYKAQVDERSRRAQKAKHKSDKSKQKVAEAEKNWKGRLQESERARGGSSTTPASGSDTPAEPATEEPAAKEATTEQ